MAKVEVVRKTCSSCKQIKAGSEFTKDNSKSDHLYPKCKQCIQDKSYSPDYDKDKQCPRCKKTKPGTEFWRDCRSKDGLQSYCIECASQADRTSLYGITSNQYDSMLEKQNFVCWICKNTDKRKRLAVDHDHVTGRIRGLLCSKCNSGIAMFRDSVFLLKKAIEYLQED